MARLRPPTGIRPRRSGTRRRIHGSWNDNDLLSSAARVLDTSHLRPAQRCGRVLEENIHARRGDSQNLGDLRDLWQSTKTPALQEAPRQGPEIPVDIRGGPFPQ